MKIVIIGHSGSGKSTLSNVLDQYYGCPLLHLDNIHFASNCQEKTDKEIVSAMSSFMLQEHWVIEGNYLNCLYEERMREADCIIYLNFDRFNCFFRVFRRYLKYKGQTRPDMADGCKEKFNLEFMKWILIDGRLKEKLKKYQIIIDNYPHKTILLKNQRQLTVYQASLTERG